MPGWQVKALEDVHISSAAAGLMTSGAEAQSGGCAPYLTWVTRVPA